MIWSGKQLKSRDDTDAIGPCLLSAGANLSAARPVSARKTRDKSLTLLGKEG
jgi:hypothetical protein